MGKFKLARNLQSAGTVQYAARVLERLNEQLTLLSVRTAFGANRKVEGCHSLQGHHMQNLL